MEINLASRTALVTGSTSGIGYATVEGLARAGATVIINGRHQHRVDEVVQKLRTVGDVRGVAADVATDEGVARLLAAEPDVDVLVNNVGIFSSTAVFDIPDAEWRRFFEVNVLTGVRLARHYAPRMMNRGWGRVIFVSSDSALTPPPGMVHYGMTKVAQLSVARGMAQAAAGTGVTVNSVLAGPTLTAGLEQLITDQFGDGGEEEFLAAERSPSLLGRLIRPYEVANLITYLASNLASATTGAAVRVDGGITPTIIP
jgi:NAD(P)-dependent dehydrogenase (short-subunit alcohol dehydrogenase family)